MDSPQYLVHESDTHGTFTEFLYNTENSIILLAPHGGQVEPNTDTEAMIIGQYIEGASIWGTRGIVDGGYDDAYNRWHTSSKTDPLHAFPLYQQLQQHNYQCSISFHVMSEDGIIIGGRAPKAVRESLQKVLEKYFPTEDIRLGVKGGPRAGMNPHNFVNNLSSSNPIHIEQSTDIAMNHPKKFSRAIIEWLSVHMENVTETEREEES